MTRAAARRCTTGSRSTATRIRKDLDADDARIPRRQRELQLMTMPLTPAHFALGESASRSSSASSTDAGNPGADRRVHRPARGAAYRQDAVHLLGRQQEASDSSACFAVGRRARRGTPQVLASAAVPRRPARLEDERRIQAGIAALQGAGAGFAEAARRVARQLRPRHVRTGRVEQGAGRQRR